MAWRGPADLRVIVVQLTPSSAAAGSCGCWSAIGTKCTASEAPGRRGQVWNRSDLLDAAAWLVPWASRRPSARRPVQGGPQETTVQTSESDWCGGRHEARADLPVTASAADPDRSNLAELVSDRHDARLGGPRCRAVHDNKVGSSGVGFLERRLVSLNRGRAGRVGPLISSQPAILLN